MIVYLIIPLCMTVVSLVYLNEHILLHCVKVCVKCYQRQQQMSQTVSLIVV
jgi:hypothetical protein